MWRRLCRARRGKSGPISAREFDVVYESRAGLIKLLHRLELEYHKPEVIGRKLDAEKQRAFIETYNDLLNSLGPDEARAVRGRGASNARGATRGLLAPAGENLAIEQTSGSQRLNIHGAIDLRPGKTAMIDVETVDAASTIRLLEAIEAMYPLLVMIHVFLDNARYHHAKLVRNGWSSRGAASRCISFPPIARI